MNVQVVGTRLHHTDARVALGHHGTRIRAEVTQAECTLKGFMAPSKPFSDAWAAALASGLALVSSRWQPSTRSLLESVSRAAMMSLNSARRAPW